MTPPKAPRAHAPLILSDKEEQILEAVHFLGYVTAQDINHVLFSEGSRVTVRRILAKLSGDNDTEAFLYRFPLPATTKGTKQYIYALGAKGREALAVAGFYRPYKLRYLSYSHISHHLTLTRFVCSALVWCRTNPQVRLADIRLSSELARELGKGEAASEGSPVPVPDGWLNFELLAGENGAHMTYVPTWIEIDKGSEYRLRFQQLVEDRIEFIRSGQYARFFAQDAVRIAYATTGSRPEFRHSRLSALRAWTQEVLTDLELQDWANVFYFTSLVYEDLYTLKHFTEPVWYTPGDPTPKLLLEQ